MRTFLMWRSRSRTIAAAEVATALRRLYAPLLGGAVEQTVREGPHASVVGLHLPVLNWLPPFVEHDADRWVEAIDYPLDSPVPSMLDLAQALIDDRRRWLPELAPPFSLIHGDVGSRDAVTWVHNDALGQAQLFVYEDDDIWALSNRIFAFRVLGIPLDPVPLEWAARAVLGWFPLTTTGYRSVRLLEGGTAIRIDAEGVHEDRVDVLGDWVSPPRLPAPERLELARRSLADQIDGLIPRWRRPCVGLSGGWDSRVIVSTMVDRRADFVARVKGSPNAQDVVLAKQLARIANIELRHVRGAELPGSDASDTRASICSALLWGAGHSDTTKHKSEFAHGRRIVAAELNVMGQHGELARASLYRPGIEAHNGRRDLLSGDRIVEYYVDILFALKPAGLREDLHAPIRSLIRTALHQAGRYDIPGFGWMDFFYLYEVTRRRSAGSLTAQGSLVVAPFLNPNFIRACFSGTNLALHDDVIHRYIIEHNLPAWSEVPFTRKGDNVQTKAQNEDELSEEEANFYHLHGSLYYDSLGFWQSSGAELLEPIHDGDGLWSEVFDPDAVRAHPLAAPDEITLLLMLPDVIERAGRSDARPAW